MIEEFIQRLQQTEVEAEGILASAKEKVQTINRDLESSLAEVRASASQELQHRLDAIDKQINEQVDGEQRQLRQEMKQQLEDLEHGALECRQAVLERLISHLT
jgi:F0F1-type ATP synthase membrane subunit b/b'